MASKGWLGVVLAVALLLLGPAGAGLPHALAITSSADAASYPTNGVSPPPTSFAAATFDAADGYLLMFGGNDADGDSVATTWSFVHDNWTDLTDGIGPSPSARWGSAIAFDAANGTVLLFGGCLNTACSAVSNDTWTYAHDRWTNLTGALAVAPPPRGRAMMTYDAGDGAVLLFGGLGASGVYLNDLWEFQDGRWSSLSPATAPGARAGGMMAYDPASNATILFGGSSGAFRYADTWSYSDGTWSNLSASAGVGPSARWSGGMTYDGADGYLLLVNGYNSGNFLGDEWTFGGGSWTALAAGGGPDPSYGGLLVYDPLDRYVVYFSGVTSAGTETSTLIYSGGTWTLLLNPPADNFDLLFLGLFLLLILAPVAIGLVIGSVVQRSRERRLGEGFVLPPDEPVPWVTGGTALARQHRLRVLGIVAVFLLLVLVLVPISVSSGGAGFFLVVFEFPLLFALIGVFFFAQGRQEAHTIAAVRSGVVVRRRRGELRVPWGQLQPGLMRPARGMFLFQYVLPGQQTGVAGFRVTVEQARAIIESPFAHAWVLAPMAASGLGLPLQPGAGRWAPPGARPPPPEASAGDSPLPSDVRAGPVSPPPAPPPVAWAQHNPAAWTPPPTAPLPPRPVVPVGPPIGTVPCRRCGQYNPIGQVVFCQSCGQRLQ